MRKLRQKFPVMKYCWQWNMP